MVHIAEGALPLPECLAGYALTLAILCLTLWFRKLKLEDVPRLALFTIIFFVASFIHVNVGPSSVHPLFNGLGGAVLGLHSYLGIFIALLLQAVLAGHGGLSTLGVNTVDMGVPALVAYAIARVFMPRLRSARQVIALGAVIGAVSLLLTLCLTVASILVGAELMHRPEYITACIPLVLFHMPLLPVEAIVTGLALYALAVSRPDVLTVIYGEAVTRLVRHR